MKTCPLCKQQITQSETIKTLETPIESLGFSNRVKNALKRAEIETLEKLLLAAEKDLMRIRNFGKVCLREVKERIEISVGHRVWGTSLGSTTAKGSQG